MTFRKVVFWLHLVAGVVAGSVILVMSVTGVLLAFENQIVAVAERGYLTNPVPSPGTARLDLNEAVAKVREAEPDGAGAPSSVTVRNNPSSPLAVGFGREKTVFANPYTGAVLGRGSPLRGVFDKITEWHRWLGSREIGRPITGACNAAFLVLTVSGFYLWCPRRWPWNWTWPSLKSGAILKTKLRGKARDFNWHNAIGFWCAPVLFILTLTAVVMSYPWANNLIYTLTGSELPPPRTAGTPGGRGDKGGSQRNRTAGAGAATAGAPRSDINLQRLFDAATRQVPGWQSIILAVPQPGSKTASVTVLETPSARPYGRSSLTLDAKTAAVVKWEPYSGQNLGRKIRGWVRYAHTGEAGGWIGQLVAGLASAGGVVLVWTGISLSLRRFFGRKRTAAPDLNLSPGNSETQNPEKQTTARK